MTKSTGNARGRQTGTGTGGTRRRWPRTWSARAAIGRLHAEGVTILLVEQMAARALRLADRAHVRGRGRVTIEGPAVAVALDPAVTRAYLGRRGPGAMP